jgi:hypothetical protein
MDLVRQAVLRRKRLEQEDLILEAITDKAAEVVDRAMSCSCRLEIGTFHENLLKV